MHVAPNHDSIRTKSPDGMRLMSYTVEQLCSDGLEPTFRYLLPVVAANTTITYGQIADALKEDLVIEGKVFPTHIGAVVGTLMERIHEVESNAPLINVLVVNQDTGQPGIGADGFLREWFDVNAKPLSKRQKTDLVAKAAREVYAYRKWPKVFQNLFGSTAPVVDPTTIIDGTEQDGMPPASKAKGYGGPAESKEHKALKKYVFEHPASVGAPAKPDWGRPEFQLMSGDEVDVFFERGTRVDLVEVKSIRSSDPDLIRGVYQCVKYRAVFMAQRLGTTPDMQVVATLVVEAEPAAHILDLAKLHKVRVRVIRVNH
jgi:hypothetical protein